MSKIPPDFKNITIAIHPKNQQAFQLAEVIGESLQSQGKNIILGRMDEPALGERIDDGQQDLLIALGGDGTMLRAGILSASSQIPILGINLGRYGFLTEVQKDEWPGALERVMGGDFRLEKRMMLESVLFRGEEEIGRWNALNDAVITRGEAVRPIQLEIYINNRHLNAIVADALIISTATGSTAYAMAAGGPILSPELRNIIIVPLAPFLSVEQTLVLDESVQIAVNVFTSHEAVISIDGQPGIPLQTGDRVEMHASQDVVQFIRFQDPGYFYRNLIPYMDQNPAIKKTNDRN